VEWALPPGILLVASGLVAAAWRLRRQQYLPVAVARLLRIAGAGAAQLLLVLFFPPSAALLAIGALIGFAAETAVLAGVGWLRGLMPPAGVWSRLREVGGRFSRFPTTVLPAAFGGSARDSLVPILLSTFATADIVGAYWLADRVMLVPVSMLSQSVATVLFAQLSADRREDESGTEAADMRLVIRPATVIFILGVVPAVLVAIAGPVAFPLIFGAEWVEAGQLARAVAPRALLWACAFPVLPVFITHGRERLLLGWQFGSLFVLAAAIAVGAAWGSLAAVWSYSIASAAMSVVAIVLATRVCGVAWSAMPAAFAQEARWTFRTLRALPRWRP